MNYLIKSFIQGAIMLLLFTTQTAWAEIQLPAVFGDFMVLQQNTNARLWGAADAGEQIKVIASWGAEVDIVADNQGKWSMEIPTPSGSHIPQQIIFNGKNMLVLNNVLIGEVWLCSGQSNMGWPVQISDRSYEEIKNATYPSIRFFKVPSRMAWDPQSDVEASWVPCAPETVPMQSAAAYFFGRELHEELNVPVGLIVSAWGGSDAQAWIDKENAGKEGLGEIVEWYEKYEQQMREERYKYIKALAEWRTKQPETGPMDWDTRPQRKIPGDNHIPFALYNGMIHPIKMYSMKGAIWYQGESNVNRAHQYRTLFPAMIKSWRKVWDQGDFPFYYVQISPYHYNDFEGVKSAELRDAQLKTLDMLPNTGMVVTTDIGDINDIHPRKKREVGRRLAMLALHNDYNITGEEYSSPMYKSHTIEGGKIRISFDHAEQLKVRGSELVGFTIAGKDQKFIKAQAVVINDGQVEVWSDGIKKPVAARFGWSNALVTNLFNEAGLPVSPFKTDSWKDTTEGVIYLDYP